MISDKPLDRLPEYKRPPIVETALGIEFAPIDGWNLVHFGAMWERFRHQYPNTDVRPAWMFAREPNLIDPPIRFFFTNDDETEMVQMRTGAFVRNWRSQPGNEEYPRYALIRPSFEKDVKVFYAFLQESGFSQPEVWKCEVTYVNHLLRGREWNDRAELHKVFPVLSSQLNSGLLAEVTQTNFTFNYNLPDGAGELQIQVTPGLRSDGKELLQLTLTAYGKPKSNDLGHLLEWIDQGRRTVVLGFSQFTSASVQKETWGRLWP